MVSLTLTLTLRKLSPGPLPSMSFTLTIPYHPGLIMYPIFLPEPAPLSPTLPDLERSALFTSLLAALLLESHAATFFALRLALLTQMFFAPLVRMLSARTASSKCPACSGPIIDGFACTINCYNTDFSTLHPLHLMRYLLLGSILLPCHDCRLPSLPKASPYDSLQNVALPSSANPHPMVL